MQTTNKKLMRLIKKHELTAQEIADLLYVSLSAVEHWKTPDTSVSHRVMPQAMLELLEIKLDA